MKSVPEELANFGGLPDYRGIVNTLPDASHCFVFVNYLIHSHVYALRLSPDPQDHSPVLWICGAKHAVIADSLTDFLASFLGDPDSILFPDDL